ncbi:MAG: hypothetical protein OXT67_13470 [Zetaproteobacteria bacterium]|nr:hypothetical protein [Zetaproteobacteria bacterium]
MKRCARLCVVLCSLFTGGVSAAQENELMFSAANAYRQLITHFFDLHPGHKFSKPTLQKIKQTSKALAESFADSCGTPEHNSKSSAQDEATLSRYLNLLPLVNPLLLPERESHGFEFSLADLNPEIEDSHYILELILMGHNDIFNIHPDHLLEYTFLEERLGLSSSQNLKSMYRPTAYQIFVENYHKRAREHHKRVMKAFFEEGKTFAQALTTKLVISSCDQTIDPRRDVLPHKLSQFKTMLRSWKRNLRTTQARAGLMKSYQERQNQECVDTIGAIFTSPNLSTQFLRWVNQKTQQTLSYEELLKGAALSQNLLYGQLLRNFIAYMKSAEFQKQQERILQAERKLEEEKAFAIAEKYGFLQDSSSGRKAKQHNRKTRRAHAQQARFGDFPQPASTTGTHVTGKATQTDQTTRLDDTSAAPTPPSFLQSTAVTEFDLSHACHPRILRWNIPYQPHVIGQFFDFDSDKSRVYRYQSLTQSQRYHQWLEHQAFRFLALTAQPEVFEQYFIALRESPASHDQRISYLAHAALLSKDNELVQGFIVICQSQKGHWFHAKFDAQLNNTHTQKVLQHPAQLTEIDSDTETFTPVSAHQLEEEDSGIIRLRFKHDAGQLILFPLH